MTGVPAVHTSSNPADPVVFGGDVGGTSIKYGLLDALGLPIGPVGGEPRQIDSMVKQGPKVTITQMARAVEEMLSGNNLQLVGIGAAAAGFITKEGVITKSPNFGELWRMAHFQEMLAEHFGLPATLENDANAAMISEFVGLRKKYPELAQKTGMLFTIGTGLGGALVINGEVIRGDSGIATEFGHIPVRDVGPGSMRWVSDIRGNLVQCGCNKIMCAEQYTSLGFLERELQVELEKHPDHPLKAFDKGDAAKKILKMAAQQDDPLCKDLLFRQAYNLGVVINELRIQFGPSWVIVGGGITDTTDAIKVMYMQGIREGLRTDDRFMFDHRVRVEHGTDDIQIMYAVNGEDSGWMGAGISNIKRNPNLDATNTEFENLAL